MPLTPPSGTISLSISANLTVIQDLNTYWKLQLTGNPCKLTSPCIVADTQIVVSAITGPAVTNTIGNSNYTLNALSSFPTITIAIGDTITCDGEEMSVTGIDGPDASNSNAYTLTVSRGVDQTLLDGTVTTFPNANVADHPVGGQISILQYVTPWEMIRLRALMPWVLTTVQSLGANSAMFSSSANGSVTIAGS